MKTTLSVLFALFVACAPAPPPVTGDVAVVSGVSFTAHDAGPNIVQLTLTNGSDDRVGYNLCSSQLERKNASGWERIETGDVCTMEIRSLDVGQTATFDKNLPAGLASGDYRYVTRVEIPAGEAARELRAEFRR
jgi:hypothetical protein